MGEYRSWLIAKPVGLIIPHPNICEAALKAPKEYRLWIKRMVKRHGKANGKVAGMYLDDFHVEVKLETSKRRYRRARLKLCIGRQE